jgi:hypothetical protein
MKGFRISSEVLNPRGYALIIDCQIDVKLKGFVMNDVLDERLIITLVALQPRKEVVAENYVATSLSMANSCTHGACKQTCTGAPPKKRKK